MKLKTWHVEGLAVASALAGALIVSGRGGDWREWVAALGVQFGFHHASVANRLQEAEEGRSRRPRGECIPDGAPTCACIRTAKGDAHRVECVRWLDRYWVGKELAWVTYFLSTGAVSALVGCAVFLLHPFWRRWYRARQARSTT